MSASNWDFDVVILGQPASAKNQRRIVVNRGRPRLIKSAKAMDYCKTFNEQCPKAELLTGDVALRVDAYYGSRRPDNSCLDLIMDCLQGKIYDNDRQVKAAMAIWNLDRINPRARIRVRSLTIDGSAGLSSFRDAEIWGAEQ